MRHWVNVIEEAFVEAPFQLTQASAFGLPDAVGTNPNGVGKLGVAEFRGVDVQPEKALAAVGQTAERTPELPIPFVSQDLALDVILDDFRLPAHWQGSPY
ncbi:hypothetical protein LWC34_22280 [Kibdelosporangium philippinense]|uniref:Uncharacterized protein n=1 Tax=Kibdelosporangium philippinense TaxID=211113 RepID=A0ABS8ZF44_9PSEU|nr:hypothetical protein [Kibdelosporangium philippinense]MCE7005530.1 hypothetical protein [Kibdelosporangium philippinense]